ncbi:hypothetical protein [Bacillus toyonensis]|uniref:hypothetical protein n=1 Tax=Bacillus toyonensis TaxID=155322 RepID=UPI000BFA81EE|nr:hypothetical protein [Bacillus toyonensis]PGF00896.1 hypothetical protein COM61_22855 [Bacillus toyonensis]PHE46988.1 hypothetical protein COF71_13605 [Bacillus toyonensis]
MAGQATLTTITIDANGNAVVNFTYSGGASTDILYLERANSYDTPDKAVVVRKVTRGSLTQVIDYTVSNSGARYWYRIRSTNADGSGVVYSPDWVSVDTVCLDIVTIAPYSAVQTQTKLQVVQSRTGERSRETQMAEFAGRTRPVAEVGMMYNQVVNISFYVETAQEKYDIERLLMDNDFWFRDNYGRSFHGVCQKVNSSDYIAGFNMSAVLTEVDGGVNH